jgi:hypothetical protein
MEGREVKIFNAVFSGYDMKNRWTTYEYFIQAEDADDAMGAFGHNWWTHGFGDTSIHATSAPDLLVSRKTVEFPKGHRIVCVSHPDIHVGYFNYVALPDPYGSGIPTKNNRPEVKLTFGRHKAESCWTATDVQTAKIENELDPWAAWAHFGMRRVGYMTDLSLRQFGLLADGAA